MTPRRVILPVVVVCLLSIRIPVLEAGSTWNPHLTIQFSVSEPVDPEVYMNASQLITSKGYPCEEHTVQTEDGFLLGMQRIPHGKNKSGVTNKPVVLIQHGLLASSTCWLENLANESLGFILADAGMDVWLGNSRGNTYSRKHTKYNPSQEEFWAFSWDQMAKFDLPATIEYVLNATGQTHLYYIGHSQGTEMGFAEFSRNPKLGAKVKLFVALAPVARAGHMKSPIRKLMPWANDIEFLMALFGKYEFLPTDAITRWFASHFCDHSVEDLVCESIIFLFGGVDVSHLNRSRIPVYIAHNPAGTSVQNIVHYAQAVKSDRFQMFDFGSAEKNRQHYNQSTPPLYHPENMTTPVAVFWGTNDWLADPEDVQWLIPKLQHVIMNKEIKGYEHLDFIWAVNAPADLYNDIVNLINKNEQV